MKRAICIGVMAAAAALAAVNARSQPVHEFIQPRDATRVANDAAKNYYAGLARFLNESTLQKMSLSAAYKSGDGERFARAAAQAGDFYYQHFVSLYIPARLGAAAALAEMLSNDYFDEANPMHAAFLAKLRHTVSRQLQNAGPCKAQQCQVTGMTAILHAMLNAQSAQQANAAFGSLKILMEKDFGKEEDNLTVAVYAFQAALALRGADGVYSLLFAFDQAKRKRGTFYNPMRRYEAVDYRVYIEAVDVLSALGPEGLPYLKRLAWQTPMSLAAQLHANIELGYAPLSDWDRANNHTQLTQLYCRYNRDYDAYTEPLYRSVSLPSQSKGSTLLERVGYAYGGGRAPEYLRDMNKPAQCLPVVPRQIPNDVQAKELLNRHAVDLALLFVPIPGLTALKTSVSATAAVAREAAALTLKQGLKQAGEAAARNLGKIAFRMGGKRAGFAVMSQALNYPRKEALAQLYKWGAKPTWKTARLSGETHLIKNLDLHAITLDAGPLPSFPSVANPQRMYRGMALDQKAIQNITDNGLLLKDVKGFNNDLLVGYAGSLRGSGAAHIAKQKVICLTNESERAASYATQRMSKGAQIPTVVEAEGLINEKLLMAARDIPAAQIKRVSALLAIDGKPTWGLLESAADGFLFRPYLP